LCRHALGGQPFQIHFFYGEPSPDTDPSDYGHAPNLIGTYRIFTGPNMQAISRRSVDAQSKISTGQISLSPVLATAMEKGVIDETLTPGTVVPQLSQNLNWRVTDAAGREVDTQDLVDRGHFAVAVVSRDVQPIRRGEEHLFPGHGPWMEYGQATAGRVGGVSK
jgi:tyrosinase